MERWRPPGSSHHGSHVERGHRPPVNHSGRVVLVVPHTHWDREWYKSAEAYRPWLVDLIDALLDDPRAGPFLLDGQAIVLEDYLRVRPERRGAVQAALAAGRLDAGPWYVLPDLLLPGREALIRNLLAGRRMMSSLGGTEPGVFYCPDSFGHSAAGPGLARGFGFPLAVAWRGLGGRLWPAGDSLRWRARSGDEVLLYHLPPSGYESGANLPVQEQAASLRWAGLSAALGDRASLGVLLVLNGADHHAGQERLADAIEALAMAADPVPVRLVRLVEARDDFVRRASAATLPVVAGELRASPDYTWALQGTGSARASQKRANAMAERLLVRDAEPWAALAWWHTGACLAPELRDHWRTLLTCHPHDTLCGCSIDQVASAFDARIESALAGAAETRRRALGHLVGLRMSSPRPADIPRPWLLVRNALAEARGGVVEMELDVAIARVPVGPGSADAAPAGGHARPVHVEGISRTQVIGKQRCFTRVESSRDYPVNLLVERRLALGWVDAGHAVPGLAVRAQAIREGHARARPVPEAAEVRAGTIRNAHVSAWSDAALGLCVATPQGFHIEGLLGFEVEGERGDLYTHSAIPGTLASATLVRQSITRRGPLAAEIGMLWRVAVPSRQVRRGTGEVVVQRRGTLTVSARVQVRAGSPLIRLEVDGVNSLHDIRLRAVVRTCISGHAHIADCADGPVRRENAAPATRPGDVEILPATAPLHRYVSVYSEASGASLLSDGLAEYEVTPTADIKVTLLRAVGELSRADLPERPGHAGWPTATPGAQVVGPFAARMALLLHGPATDEAVARVEREAQGFLSPLLGFTAFGEAGGAGGLGGVRGVELRGDGLRMDACKLAEAGGAMVLRCTNLLDRVVAGEWVVPGVGEAWLARLDESVIGALVVGDGRLRFEVRPHAVSTILVQPRPWT